jgi:hypothetical protein
MSYARNAQYMQVLQNNSLSYTSIETWFPATKNTKPILADSYAIGWFLNINQKISLSIESYYKNYYNQIDFVDHAMIINNPLIEAEIRTGKAYAYGSEFLIKYNGKNCGGSIAYNYSRAFRIIDGINKGEKFSSNFDIPHDIRFSSYVNLNKKWTFSTAWTYMSGRPVTLPIGFYYESGFPVPIFSDRNSSRLPDYHRMDIAFNYSNKSNDKKTYFDINLGIYNIYARRNPIGYYFSRPLIANDGIEGYQYILFTILPNFSIKYNF